MHQRSATAAGRNPLSPDSSETVLVVEDDPNTRELIQMYLEQAGFDVSCAAEGRRGLELALALEPSLVVLDLMLPGIDGWAICRSLRQSSDVPILILSARQEEEDRLLGLGLGADDYVVKPFSPREVVMRVQAILRRSQRARPAPREDEPTDDGLGSGPIRVDPERRTASSYGTEVVLTPSEYRLLCAMMRRPGRTFDRSELLGHLYPSGGSAVPKVIDVHIGKLRQKLEPQPSEPRHVQTVRGFGYRFVE